MLEATFHSCLRLVTKQNSIRKETRCLDYALNSIRTHQMRVRETIEIIQV